MTSVRSITGAIAAVALVLVVVAYLRNDPPNTEAPPTVSVERVIDGDTFTATSPNGEDLGRIRALGIDTPEMARDGNPAECHASEATKAAKQLLDGRTVQISPDPSQEERDVYDRLLAYVDVEGTDFAEVMLTNGHARLYEGSSLTRQDAYDEAASRARDAGAGLWEQCG